MITRLHLAALTGACILTGAAAASAQTPAQSAAHPTFAKRVVFVGGQYSTVTKAGASVEVWWPMYSRPVDVIVAVSPGRRGTTFSAGVGVDVEGALAAADVRVAIAKIYSGTVNAGVEVGLTLIHVRAGVGWQQHAGGTFEIGVIIPIRRF